MVDISPPQYTYTKRGVFYFSKSVPTDLRHHYLKPRIVQSLKTKSQAQARYASQKLLSRLDDYWLSLRLKEIEIPAAHLLRQRLVKIQNLFFHQLLMRWSFTTVLRVKTKRKPSSLTAKGQLTTLFKALDVDPLISTQVRTQPLSGIGYATEG